MAEATSVSKGHAALPDEEEVDDFDPHELDQFDYFRFTLADLNGIARCVSLPRRHVEDYLENGLGFFAGFLGVTVTTDPVCFSEIEAVRFGNACLKPMKGTLRPLPWATRGKHRVGDFLCEMFWMPPFRDGGPQEACPRFVARRQLDRLRALGYTLYSTFEAEFSVLRRADQKPIFGGPQHSEVCTSQLLAEFEEFLYDSEHLLTQGGIDISKLHTEYGPGQLEFVPQPGFGVDGADTMFRLREALKEICRLRDWEATFMAQPFPDWPPTGLHFNHSLWTTDRKCNVMYDADHPDRLSDVARWWVAGLLEHSAALMALCCPTVNCYRRPGGSFAPTFADWAIDDRHATFRVKNYGPKETYVENRMPSGPANPYLVTAATIAAGIDGITRKLTCPAQRGNGQAVPLAATLAAALDALEGDQIMKDSLGEEFVRWFVQNKREGEVNKLKDSTIEVERQMYILNI